MVKVIWDFTYGIFLQQQNAELIDFYRVAVLSSRYLESWRAVFSITASCFCVMKFDNDDKLYQIRIDLLGLARVKAMSFA